MVNLWSVRERDIPNSERRLIISAFNRQGIEKPTSGQIVFAYQTRRRLEFEGVNVDATPVTNKPENSTEITQPTPIANLQEPDY